VISDRQIVTLHSLAGCTVAPGNIGKDMCQHQAPAYSQYCQPDGLTSHPCQTRPLSLQTLLVLFLVSQSGPYVSAVKAVCSAGVSCLSQCSCSHTPTHAMRSMTYMPRLWCWAHPLSACSVRGFAQCSFGKWCLEPFLRKLSCQRLVLWHLSGWLCRHPKR